MRKGNVKRVVKGLMLLMPALLATAKPVEDISFNQGVLPILKRHCIICHMAGGAQGEFSLYPDPYENLVAAGSKQSRFLQVKPGSVEDSYLYHKLVDTHLSVGGEGASMPYQRDLLESADIEIIRGWILQGAKRN